KPYFSHMDASWTGKAMLPGGEAMTTPQALADEISASISGIDPALAQRWANTYGSCVWRLLGDARTLDALGEDLGQNLYAREVDYLCSQEWATQADDILWRRTKLGLAFSAPDLARLQSYLNQRLPASSINKIDAA